MRRKWMCMGLWLVMVAPCVSAQEAANVAEAQVNLDSTLVSLRQSVARLSLENEEIGRLNNTLRGQIKKAEEELAVSQREEARTGQQYQALEATYKQKRDAVQTLEERSMQLDKMSSDIGREAEQVLAALKVREEEASEVATVAEVLAEQVKELRQRAAEPVVRISTSEAIDQHKLARDLAATEASLIKTREEWLSLQRLIEGGSGQLDLLKTENAALRVKIKEVSDGLASVQASLSQQEAFVKRVSAADTAPEVLAALEGEVRGLSDEISSLQKEFGRLEKERIAKSRKGTDAKEAEIKKIKASYDELKVKNFALREELKKLRQSMVTMDKKKAGLEKQIYTP